MQSVVQCFMTSRNGTPVQNWRPMAYLSSVLCINIAEAQLSNSQLIIYYSVSDERQPHYRCDIHVAQLFNEQYTEFSLLPHDWYITYKYLSFCLISLITSRMEA